MYKTIILVCLCLIMGCKDVDADRRTAPERAIETVVIVNSSSGIAVYCGKETTLILTAAHVSSESDQVMMLSVEYEKDIGRISAYGVYPAIKTWVFPPYDLALIEINTPSEHLECAKVSTKNMRLGEDIYLASNPSYNYRSIRKGVISSKVRTVNKISVWEVTGGSMYGSSGGGAFTTDGELFGISSMVDHYNTGHCRPGAPKDCVVVPIPFLGWYIPPHHIKEFLLDSPYAEYFKYLK